MIRGGFVAARARDGNDTARTVEDDARGARHGNGVGEIDYLQMAGSPPGRLAAACLKASSWAVQAVSAKGVPAT
jgi:hypothetical protein